ncbi:SGNH/GDSL hydrolase family protein [Paenibacillus luteus]|uniref:SGNH/GDSL hydrolase family protein n=1 Tax=Paenibacillus luteus TaxID=2545753 RepID=UPI001143F81E|nr:SGNH/GDSL hydrolase family protein [Paenibacillus luteus]
MNKIIILGDSLALPRPIRFRDYNPDESLELEIEFEDTYGYLLQMRYKESAYVINRAVRSSTIKLIYERDKLDHIFLLKPNVIILHIGIVDLWPRETLEFRSYLNIEEFAYYYRMVFESIEKLTDVKVICIGISPTSTKMDEKFIDLLSKINDYNEVIKSMCLKKGHDYLDMTKFINQDNLYEYILSDDHHLNKSGNMLVYNEIVKFIENK